MFFRAVSALVFRCVFWLVCSSFFFIVPRCFRSARKRPTGAIHCKNHMMFMFFQGALSHRRGQQGRENAHKTNQKQLPRNAANRCFFVFFQRRRKETQKARKRAPREAQMPPRSAPGGARSGPRGAKTAPGTARSAPGAPQEPPKTRQKRSQKGLPLSFPLSGGLREPF